MEKDDISKGLEQVKCISEYLKLQNTVRHRCMLNFLEKEFRKAYFLVSQKGFGYFKKLEKERKEKRYLEFKQKIEEERLRIEKLKKSVESAQDEKDKKQL